MSGMIWDQFEHHGSAEISSSDISIRPRFLQIAGKGIVVDDFKNLVPDHLIRPVRDRSFAQRQELVGQVLAEYGNWGRISGEINK